MNVGDVQGEDVQINLLRSPPLAPTLALSQFDFNKFISMICGFYNMLFKIESIISIGHFIIYYTIYIVWFVTFIKISIILNILVFLKHCIVIYSKAFNI